jgi:putative hydrolase of HD superfamily
MVLVHDLAEARTGDVPIFQTSLREQKKSAERKAMREFRTQLPKDVGPWIYELWEEFEAKETAEAKIANALDKLEAQIQHNEADLKSWIEWEKIRVFGGLDAVTAVDQSIVQLKDATIKEAILKLKKGGEDITSLRKKARNNKG